MAKTKFWTADLTTALPAHWENRRIPVLRYVGAEVAYARGGRAGLMEDWRDVPLTTLVEMADASQFLELQQRYLQRLEVLRLHGLSTAGVFHLLRVWSQGACVHLQRALPLPAAWAQAVDEGLVDNVMHLVGVPLDGNQTRQLFLRIADGGFGLGSAVWRGEAAWVGAWEGGLAIAAAQCHISSFEEFCGQWPQWHATVTAMETRLAAKLKRPVTGQRWADRLVVTSKPKTQRDLARAVLEAQALHLRAQLPAAEVAKLSQSASPHAVYLSWNMLR